MLIRASAEYRLEEKESTLCQMGDGKKARIERQRKIPDIRIADWQSCRGVLKCSITPGSLPVTRDCLLPYFLSIGYKNTDWAT